MYNWNACIVMYWPHTIYFSAMFPVVYRIVNRERQRRHKYMYVWTVLVYRTVQLAIQHSRLPFYKWHVNRRVPDLLILLVVLSICQYYYVLRVFIALILHFSFRAGKFFVWKYLLSVFKSSMSLTVVQYLLSTSFCSCRILCESTYC